MQQSGEDGEPQSTNASETNGDGLSRGTTSPDRRSSSFPTESPVAATAAQLDPPDNDPLDSCETIPVPREPECTARSQDEDPSSPSLALHEDAQITAREPVASDPEPAGVDPVVELRESHAATEESGAPDTADDSKADMAFDCVPGAGLPDEKPPAEVHEAPSSSSSVARDETSDATSSSAHVLPVAADPNDESEESAIASEAAAPATRESAALRGIKGSRWLGLAAVAMVLGFWWLPRLTPEQAKPQDTPAPVAAPVVGGDPRSSANPVPPSGTIAQSPAAPPAAVITEKTEQMPIASEPPRLSGYKAAASAARNASKCRYAGDSPGVVQVVVTFDPSGRVQRTRVPGNLANPMTLQCITSKFDELTIPAFSGAATSVAVRVKIY